MGYRCIRRGRRLGGVVGGGGGGAGECGLLVVRRFRVHVSTNFLSRPRPWAFILQGDQPLHHTGGRQPGLRVLVPALSQCGAEDPHALQDIQTDT